MCIFFAKDLEGRFVAAGPGLLRLLGFSSEEKILGLTDENIHPARVVRDIRADDRRVMETGVPLIDRVEALFTRSHAKDWYVTTKLPILDTRGAVMADGYKKTADAAKTPGEASVTSPLDPVTPSP